MQAQTSYVTTILPSSRNVPWLNIRRSLLVPAPLFALEAAIWRSSDSRDAAAASRGGTPTPPTPRNDQTLHKTAPAGQNDSSE